MKRPSLVLSGQGVALLLEDSLLLGLNLSVDLGASRGLVAMCLGLLPVSIQSCIELCRCVDICTYGQYGVLFGQAGLLVVLWLALVLLSSQTVGDGSLVLCDAVLAY